MACPPSTELRDELWECAQAVGVGRRPAGLWLKRLMDFAGALILLVLAAPLLLLLVLLIRLDSPGPAVFRQRRLGRWGRPFLLYKLRTMVQNAETQGAGLAITRDDARITRVGHFLRLSSLDELPQLWNILKGEMSFIGPRPLPVAYLGRWDRRQKVRLVMPQGMSGWSQVIARNDAPWPERLERDVEYARDWSPALDLRIFFLTLGRVFSRSGVANSEGVVEEFKPATPPVLHSRQETSK